MGNSRASTFAKRFGFITAGIAALIAFSACGKKSSSNDFGSTPPGGSPGAPGATPSPATSYPFEVILTSQYEQGGPITTEADCQVPATTPAKTTLACTNTAGTIDNTVAIPEGRLFFSNLTFTINVGQGSQSNGCEIVIFQPYFYYASHSATYAPPWGSAGATLDCSGTSSIPGADCYGGIAKDLVTNFPSNVGMYFSAYSSSTQSFTSKSGNAHHYGSNRWAVNNLAVASRGVKHGFTNNDTYDTYPSNGKYVYADYYFQCADRYLDPVYAFTMTLTDIDSNGVYPNTSQGNSAINQRTDWSPASWDFSY